MNGIEGHEVILRYSTDIVSVHEPDGTMQYVSPSVERILGYEPETVIGRSVFEFLHDADIAVVEDALSEALADPEGTETVKFRIANADGEWRWLESTDRGVLPEASNGGLVVSSRDITDHVRQERQLNAIIENASQAIYIKDTEGRYQLINRAGAAFFDMTPEEVVGCIDEDLFDAESARDIRQMDQRIMATETAESVESVRQIDGNELVFLDNKFPYYGEGGEVMGIVGLSREITERKRQEQAVRQLKEEFETVFQNAQDALFLVEVEDGEFRYSRFNPADERLTGVPTAAVQGKTPREAFGAETGAELEARYQQCLDQGEPICYEEELTFSDGTRTWQTKLAPVIVDGEVQQIVGSAQDITERKRRELQLQELHGATMRLMDAETKAEIAETAVEEASQLLGYPLSTIWYVTAEKSGLELVAGTDQARELLLDVGVPYPVQPRGGWLWQVFEEGTPTAVDSVNPDDLTVDIPVRSMVLVPLNSYGVLACGTTETVQFTDEEVSLVTLLGRSVTTALTELERQQELRRQNEQLEQFASVVSHDLRNPLTVASLRTELAREEHDSEHLAAIEAAHEKMESLIEDILTLARRGDAIDQTVPVSLSTVASEAWSSLDTGNAVLDVVDDFRFEADPSRTTQLFENLFRNAVEHGAPRVSDDVGDAVDHSSTSPQQAEGAVEHGPPDEETATLTVRVGSLAGDATTDGLQHQPSGFYVEDDGPGIPPEERDRVFESGYTTSSEGTGFGLAIVERIAEAHGWTNRVTESEAGGARFEFSGVRRA
ncbi:PAS domain-containing protein [Haloarchaeobius sp. DFWS5]|uniref:PAS domain-containing protein n=1 Tax=Haloarchaeobius sp. DFWS5 TaxID=3446114 RepID=UPI003EBCF66F